jgi:capsular exopolysaccharide synthesis family protein
LDQRLQTAEEELSAGLVRFGPNHRIVQDARMLRDSAADRVAEERAKKTVEYQNEQVEAATQNYLEAQSQLLAITEQLFEARAEQEDMDRKYANLQRMQGEADQFKMQYEQLLETKHLMNMTLRAKRAVQIDIQSQAIQPERIASPLWQVWFPVGGVLGLAISVGFAMLLELADKSVRTARDVQRQAIPVLGTIPASEDEEIEITHVETVCIDASQSILAEAFRNLRANLFFTAPADQQGVLLVTSPSGGNGKTTVATNLAISIALSGRRVLLVDANFRRPSLPRVFPGMRDDGLSNLLIGQCHLDDVVVPTSVPGLDVLSAGPPPPNPAELLGSSYLRDAIVDARARYDQVIFDGPPVLLVSDAMVLAGAVDGVLLVCQYRTTSRGALQRTQNQLEAINARIFGAVLNRVETRAGGYFRKAYREFYDYTEPESPEAAEARQLRSDEAGARLQGPPPGGSAAGAAGDVPATPATGIDQLVAGSAPSPDPATPPRADEADLESIDGLGDDLDLAIDVAEVPEPDSMAPSEPADSIDDPLSPDEDLDRQIDNLGAEEWLTHDEALELGDDDLSLTDDEAPPELPDEPDPPQKPSA